MQSTPRGLQGMLKLCQHALTKKTEEKYGEGQFTTFTRKELEKNRVMIVTKMGNSIL